ncbi:MAG: radical SAM protein [Methanoregulaceae archaeon]|jgi:biotin synthase-related radical SAM superfamily protein|nr:radical SAM protein [Methanoregulaceae archaeon]
MHGQELKAALLAVGKARLTGPDATPYISSSTAGPGAGGEGSVFFSNGSMRVRFACSETGPVEIIHAGEGAAILRYGEIELSGRLEPVGLHCPEQAYITVSSGCIFNCRYCNVPLLPKRRKSIEEIHAMVEGIKDRIVAISITSGVFFDISEEEDYVCRVVRDLAQFGLPIGVSIYPTEETPSRLYGLGVKEVKFNLECATPELFAGLCPGHDRDLILRVLRKSVLLFGRDHVFSNVILGLGETDEEMDACIRELTTMGVIPVIRPLNPIAGFSGSNRPGAERMLKIAGYHEKALQKAGLDTRNATTMCVRCRGCDLVPGEPL